jgi:ATP-dependent DNA helicase RecG
MPDPAPHDDSLTTPAQFAPSVGPRRAPLLEKLGLHTVEDILWYLPRDVLDLTDLRAVQQLEEGIVQTVHGVVVDLDARQLARGKTMAAALLDCEGQYLRGTWFNQPWMLSKFEHGQHVLFSGKPKKRGGRWEMSHPQIQWLDDDPEEITGGLLPRYGLTEGLKMYEMRRITKAAVEKYVDLVPDSLPNSLRETLQLPDLKSALRSLHSPTDRESFDVARHRLIFDDLFVFQLALALRRRYWRNTERAPKLPTSAKIDARIRRLFPFRFTAGQDTAVTEIVADLDSGRTMHRLLQADVGAGKTAVALYAMLVAIAAGHQTVLMAPTEVLALQHWQTVEQALAKSGPRTNLHRRRSTDHRHAGRHPERCDVQKYRVGRDRRTTQIRRGATLAFLTGRDVAACARDDGHPHPAQSLLNTVRRSRPDNHHRTPSRSATNRHQSRPRSRGTGEGVGVYPIAIASGAASLCGLPANRRGRHK